MVLFFCVFTGAVLHAEADSAEGEFVKVPLPQPEFEGTLSIEEVLLERRSVREFDSSPVTIQEVSQLLWAAQGLTAPTGLRTAPSAGALYPLEVYVLAGNVRGLEKGMYHYDPEGHQLIKKSGEDLRGQFSESSHGQVWVKYAPVVFVLCAVPERVTARYGERGNAYVLLEAGHAAQNLSLQAVGLKLGTVMVGAFYENEIADLMNLAKEEKPYYLIPAGKARVS